MDTQESVSLAFKEMSIQFLESAAAAWPSDALVPLAVAQVKKLEAQECMSLFQTHLGPFLDGLARKDCDVLFEAAKLEPLAALCIEDKFTKASAATRETIWVYLGHLCRFSGMNKLYKHIPTRVLGAVNDAAAALKAELDTGLDASTVNPFELGQKVMSKFAPEDIEAMMKDMMRDPEAVSAMMSQMTSMMGSGGLPGMPSGLDMTSLMNQFMGPSGAK